MTKAKKIVSRCESCVNYVFDEDCECYCCMVDLDEDEAYRSMSDSEYSCPYYRSQLCRSLQVKYSFSLRP